MKEQTSINMMQDIMKNNEIAQMTYECSDIEMDKENKCLNTNNSNKQPMDICNNDSNDISATGGGNKNRGKQPKRRSSRIRAQKP